MTRKKPNTAVIVPPRPSGYYVDEALLTLDFVVAIGTGEKGEKIVYTSKKKLTQNESKILDGLVGSREYEFVYLGKVKVVAAGNAKT